MDYFNPVFGQNQNDQLEIVIKAIRISKQKYQISTDSTMKKGDPVRAYIPRGMASDLPADSCSGMKEHRTHVLEQ